MHDCWCSQIHFFQFNLRVKNIKNEPQQPFILSLSANTFLNIKYTTTEAHMQPPPSFIYFLHQLLTNPKSKFDWFSSNPPQRAGSHWSSVNDNNPPTLPTTNGTHFPLIFFLLYQCFANTAVQQIGAGAQWRPRTFTHGFLATPTTRKWHFRGRFSFFFFVASAACWLHARSAQTGKSQTFCLANHRPQYFQSRQLASCFYVRNG